MSTDTVEGKWSDKLGTLPEQMERLAIVSKLTLHGAAAMGSGATMKTLVVSAENVAETAKLIGDVSKVVRGVSNIFHLLALIAQGMSMYAEASRGRRTLPATLCRIGIYLENVIDEDFVF